MRSTNRPSRPARRPVRAALAFTLVELLVVIGIIALLISILLPSLNSARQQASNIKCMSNLRVLGTAMALYLNENKQVFPAVEVNKGIPVGTSTTSNLAQAVQNSCNWFNALDQYLNRNLKNFDYISGGSTTGTNRNYGLIKQDPVWPTLPGSDTTGVSGNQSARTYKMNVYLGVKPEVWAAGYTSIVAPVWTRATRLKHSSDTVVLFDSTAPDCIVSSSLGLSSGDTLQTAWSGDEAYIGLRHTKGKSANVLCADGHVGSFTQAIVIETLSKTFPASSNSSGTDTLKHWYYEYQNPADRGTVSDTASQRLDKTERHPDQQLYWNYNKAQ